MNKKGYIASACFFIILGISFAVVCALAVAFDNKSAEEPNIFLFLALVSVGFFTVPGLILLKKATNPKGLERLMKQDKERADARQKNKSKKAAAQTITKVWIVGSDSKVSTGSAIGRAVVGDFVAGGVGSIVGASTAKKSGMTKFLVEYADGHRNIETVPDNSARFKELIKYVEL